MNATTSSSFHPSHANRPPAARPAGHGRPLAALLLAAAVAALAVAAERLMASWSDEHLLATWLGLWAVVFAGSLLLAGTARRTAQRMLSHLDRWARHRAEARAEARALLLAQYDPRLLAELQAARDRASVMPTPSAVTTDNATAHADATPWSSTAAIELGGRVRIIHGYV